MHIHTTIIRVQAINLPEHFHSQKDFFFFFSFVFVCVFFFGYYITPGARPPLSRQNARIQHLARLYSLARLLWSALTPIFVGVRVDARRRKKEERVRVFIVKARTL